MLGVSHECRHGRDIHLRLGQRVRSRGVPEVIKAERYLRILACAVVLRVQLCDVAALAACRPSRVPAMRSVSVSMST